MKTVVNEHYFNNTLLHLLNLILVVNIMILIQHNVFFHRLLIILQARKNCIGKKHKWSNCIDTRACTKNPMMVDTSPFKWDAVVKQKLLNKNPPYIKTKNTRPQFKSKWDPLLEWCSCTFLKTIRLILLLRTSSSPLALGHCIKVNNSEYNIIVVSIWLCYINIRNLG